MVRALLLLSAAIIASAAAAGCSTCSQNLLQVLQVGPGAKPMDGDKTVTAGSGCLVRTFDCMGKHANIEVFGATGSFGVVLDQGTGIATLPVTCNGAGQWEASSLIITAVECAAIPVKPAPTTTTVPTTTTNQPCPPLSTAAACGDTTSDDCFAVLPANAEGQLKCRNAAFMWYQVRSDLTSQGYTHVECRGGSYYAVPTDPDWGDLKLDTADSGEVFLACSTMPGDDPCPALSTAAACGDTTSDDCFAVRPANAEGQLKCRNAAFMWYQIRGDLTSQGYTHVECRGGSYYAVPTDPDWGDLKLDAADSGEVFLACSTVPGDV